MDATRSSDGKVVIMKILWRPTNENELDFSIMLGTEPLPSDPANHSNYFLELLEVPGFVGMFLMVMPFMRLYNDPRILTVGEGVDFIQQLIEVICLCNFRDSLLKFTGCRLFT